MELALLPDSLVDFDLGDEDDGSPIIFLVSCIYVQYSVVPPPGRVPPSLSNEPC